MNFVWEACSPLCLGALFENPVGNPVGNVVGTLFGNPVGNPVENPVGNSVENFVGNPLGHRLWNKKNVLGTLLENFLGPCGNPKPASKPC